MTSVVDTLPTVNLPRKSLPKSHVILEGNNKLVGQLSEQFEQSRLIHSNGRKVVPVIRKIYFYLKL
jgi:hypothetical protein